MIEIKQLSGMDIEAIHAAFIAAFADYEEPISLTIEQLQYMIERRGCDLNLSFGVFDNDELVGFTLNGIGEWNGELTAYDTGTGVIKEYRQKGFATQLFDDSLPVLREHGITQYLLEVIRTNKKAYDLYTKAGFAVTREFDYYIAPKDTVEIRGKEPGEDYSIEEIGDPDWEQFKTFWDFAPSWQNSIDAINRKVNYFTMLGILFGGRPVGYGAVEKETGDIPQIAIADKHRRKGLATALLSKLLEYAAGNVIKIINAEAGYAPFKEFVRSLNLTPGLGQYEMLKKL